MSALVLVFAGLPGAGKTHLARAVAERLGATFLRIDTIESAVASTLMPIQDSPVGYVAAEWVAQDQLTSGRDVVIDACNDVEIAREGWRDLAERTGARLAWVEVVCSDPVEHRRRLADRDSDWPGQGNPSWEQVQLRAAGWEPLTEERLLVDNVGAAAPHVEAVLAHAR